MTSDNEQEMREAFEKYCESISLPLDAYPSAIRKHTNSYYVNSNTEKSWLAWQAAIAAYEGALKDKGEELIRSRPDFHEDDVEQLAFELAFELEEADLDSGDLVTVNREKLKAISRRVLSKVQQENLALKQQLDQLTREREGLLEWLTNEIELGQLAIPHIKDNERQQLMLGFYTKLEELKSKLTQNQTSQGG